MVQIFTEPETISIELPNAIALFVTGEQFDILALANPDLRLERTAEGELILTLLALKRRGFLRPQFLS
ncbi:hypothetical protein QUB19_29735 [Microcoleus sp. B4-C5]|uniref:hypothetical protein n=1 Tax=unclassified Microcoleus TaxID=2642155 RepID=UPI002FD4B6F8